MRAADVSQALGGKKAGAGYAACCPAHEDHNPSLTLTDGNDGRLLWNCHAGCSQDAVRDALTARGLLNGHAEEPRSEFAITGIGTPSQVWSYRDAGGHELMKVARYDTPKGKEFRPWRFDHGQWICQSLPDPRPLYGLDLISARPGYRVLVVEGEKCAEAARKVIGDRFVIITWPGGAKAVTKVDWQPLRGRTVTVWPDADRPGHDAATTILARLRGIATSTSTIDAGERPEGWDIADAIAEGWAADDLLTFIDEHAAQPAGTAEAQPDGVWPHPIDLKALGETEPEPPRFIVPGWLPAAYAILLAGHGGAGKSLIALFLCVCIALGIDFFDLPTQRRRVLYLSCEDRKNLLHWRLHHICAHLGVSIASLEGWLEVLDLVGHDPILWDRDPKTGNTITPGFVALEERIHASEIQVLVVDGISDTFGGNENSRSEVKRFVNALLSTIPDDGALLLLGHVSKLGANADTDEGYSGSTQWHNAVRARMYLRPETVAGDSPRPERTGNLILELQKANLGRADQALSFRWDDSARLFLADGITSGTAGGIVASIRARTERRAVLQGIDTCTQAGRNVATARQANQNAAAMLTALTGFPASLKGKPGRNRIFDLLLKLEADGAIERELAWSTTRNRTERWHITDAGKGELATPEE